MLEAIAHRGSLKTGDTRPQVFICQNGEKRERWVLKLSGAAASELAADWIGCILALRLQISTPLVEIANVSREALLTAPDDVRSWARPGPAFASQEVRCSDGSIEDATIASMETGAASNASLLGSLFVLDIWLEVLDRRKPDGIWNLLHDLDTETLCAIDFGKGLTPCFGVMLGDTQVPIYPDYPLSIRKIASRLGAIKTAAMISEITDDDLTEIVDSVPHEWIDDAGRARALGFLSSRRLLAQQACDRLGEAAQS